VRGYVCLGVSLFLAGCGATQVAAVSVRETGVAASCAALSPAAQFAGARRVFVGEMLAGPTARMGSRQVLAAPARMRVARYLKGHGPRTVTVDTAVTVDRHGITVAEDGIEPRAGQRWKIFTNSRHQPFDTSICAGSAPMRSAGNGKRTVRAALDLWSALERSRTAGRGVAPAHRRGVDD
jgi:hypothetical protein